MAPNSKQAAAIRKAYDAITEIAECSSHSDAAKLRRAFALERQGRSGKNATLFAKAILCGAYMDGHKIMQEHMAGNANLGVVLYHLGTIPESRTVFYLFGSRNAELPGRYNRVACSLGVQLGTDVVAMVQAGVDAWQAAIDSNLAASQSELAASRMGWLTREQERNANAAPKGYYIGKPITT